MNNGVENHHLEGRKTDEEVLLKVPRELALASPGFAIDAGASVTKLLYRAKEDYVTGKDIPNNTESDEGLLRMRYFRSGSDEELISFIRDHCDVNESANEDDGWFHTGVQTQRFKKKMEEVLRTKMKTISELDAIYKGLDGFYSRVPDCRPLGLAPEAVSRALEVVRGLMRMMKSSREIGDNTFSEMTSRVDPQFSANYAMKVMTTDGATWARELSHYEIEWPCVNAYCGSGGALMVIKGCGRFDMGSFSTVSGKTFLGLGKLICGAKDFDELIEMASRGDNRKVDILTNDIKYTNQNDVDWYTEIPDSMVVFALGKLAEDSYLGTYTKEDLAAGLLHTVCSGIAKLSVAVARLTKAKCVVFNGSLISHKVAREAIQMSLLADSLLHPLIGEEPIKWVFLPHPGFVCAFGAWYQNWEKQDKRKTNTFL